MHREAPALHKCWLKSLTYTFLSFSNMPFIFSMALSAASWVSKCTKPYPFDPFSSQTTLKMTKGSRFMHKVAMHNTLHTQSNYSEFTRHVTLQDRMLPNAEKVSYSALLSIDLSKFLIKMLPTPLFLSEGSRWDHMMRTGLPLITSKFIVSRARSAGGGRRKFRPLLYSLWMLLLV